jgi:N-acetyl-anhydromuramyl-L-alanine amidase AmpD
MRGWHAGGSANNTHIGFEICEDNLTGADYFNAVYKEAVELCAKLCTQFNLDPTKDGVIICHSEGHARGIASNHADVMHWFPKHGKNMDTFRANVKAALTNLAPEVKPEVTPPPTATLPTLKKGSKGSDVKTLQTALNKFGYKLTADGDFGKLTDAAVRDFQKGHGLSADGVVGVKTWAALGV